MVGKRSQVQVTANFERNLEDIEHFLTEADAPQAYDALLDELLVTVIPHLERFPEMGRPFLARHTHSVETTTALEALRKKLVELAPDSAALREYVLSNYLLLYATIADNVYLLAIRHHRQLSFDFETYWDSAGIDPKNSGLEK